MRIRPASAVLALILAAGAVRAQTPLDTSFTYQGRLTDNGSIPTALYDFQFKLFDAAVAGNQLGGTQLANDLQVTGGLFTTPLNFGAQFTGSKRWLQIEVRLGTSVGPYTVLTTRQELTGTPNALFSELPWATGATGITYGGSVGIGATAGNNVRLSIQGTAAADTLWLKSDRGPNYSHAHIGPNGDWYIRSAANAGQVYMQDMTDAGVRIGASQFPQAKLQVEYNGTLYPYAIIGTNTAVTAQPTTGIYGRTGSSSNLSIGVAGDAGAGYGVQGNSVSGTGVGGFSVSGWGVYGTSPTGLGVYGYATTSGTGVQGSSESGNGVAGRTNGVNMFGVFGYCEGAGSTGVRGISLAGDGVYGSSNAANRSGVVGISSQGAGYGGYFYNSVSGGISLRADGLCQVKTLQILGGSDLAEPFDVAASGEQPILPGMVVVIDQAHPGSLRLTDSPYDAKVAGVISGANGLAPGMVMKAQGQEKADGQYPIAMTGRVWVWCDAATNAILPGDRLTTSEVPGHAMKADDAARAPGAVIGKAMTELKEGKGLVLVLVNLQ